MADISEINARTEILSLGAKGEGLAGEIAVPFSLPGDVIEAGQLATASPHRVAQALRSQQLPEEIRAVHVSPPSSRRRVVFSGRRTKKTVQLGFFERRSETLVPITECALLVPEIMDAFEALKGVVRMAATRSSVVKLAISASDTGLDLAVSNARDMEGEGISALAEIASGFARVSWNDEVVLLKEPPVQTFGNARVVPPPGAFLQATAHGEQALVKAVLSGVGEAAKIMDLFAGCGTFALPMAANADVLAVEYDPTMLSALDAGWRQAEGLKRVTVEARDLFRRPVLQSEFKGFDAVVLDPPRAGAAGRLLFALNAQRSMFKRTNRAPRSLETPQIPRHLGRLHIVRLRVCF